jgi:hypothetical protein
MPGNSQQVIFIVTQIFQALSGRCIALIGQVISGAGKPINSGNGRAQMGGAKPGRNRKILVMRDDLRGRLKGGAWVHGVKTCYLEWHCCSRWAPCKKLTKINDQLVINFMLCLLGRFQS